MQAACNNSTTKEVCSGARIYSRDHPSTVCMQLAASLQSSAERLAASSMRFLQAASPEYSAKPPVFCKHAGSKEGPEKI
jgi:hypothetical protein